MPHPSFRPSAPGSTDPAAAPRVALEPIARERALVLANLFQLYAHDFAEYVPLELLQDGRFDVTLADVWWTRADHFPFFVRCEGKLCGFALARRGSRVTGEHDVMDVAEFFVVRGARRRGVGARAARALFEAFPGWWEIRVRRANGAAVQFWSTVAQELTGRPPVPASVSIDGVEWAVLRLESSPAPL